MGDALRNGCRFLLGKHKGDGGGESFVCTGALVATACPRILQDPFCRAPSQGRLGRREKNPSFLCTHLISGRSVLHTLLQESLDSGVQVIS